MLIGDLNLVPPGSPTSGSPQQDACCVGCRDTALVHEQCEVAITIWFCYKRCRRGFVNTCRRNSGRIICGINRGRGHSSGSRSDVGSDKLIADLIEWSDESFFGSIDKSDLVDCETAPGTLHLDASEITDHRNQRHRGGSLLRGIQALAVKHLMAVRVDVVSLVNRYGLPSISILIGVRLTRAAVSAWNINFMCHTIDRIHICVGRTAIITVCGDTIRKHDALPISGIRRFHRYRLHDRGL